MNEMLNRLVEQLNEFIGRYPGALPLFGILFIILNLVLQIFPGSDAGWIVDANLFLHLGLLIALIGMLLIRPLR